MKRGFFKPTLFKIIIFIILLILFYWVFAANGVKIFPCKGQTVLPEPPPWQDSICPINAHNYLGVRYIFKPVSYLIMFLIFIVIPYIIAAFIDSLIRKTGKKKKRI